MNLDAEFRCRLFGKPERPRVCGSLAPAPDMCGSCRDEALARTAEIRPDLIAALDCKALDKADRKTLMALGWEVSAAHPRRLAD